MSYSVTQNTSFLTAASILQKVISSVYFIIIARIIGVGNTGQYFFAISFTTIFTVIADFGLGPVLTRETAKYPEHSEKYLNTIFWTKILFGVATYGLVIVVINFLGYTSQLRHLVYLSGVTMFFDNLHTAFYSIFRARKNLIYESVGIIASQLVTMLIGTVALVSHASLLWLILAYTIASGLNVFYAGYFVHRVYGLRRKFIIDWSLLKLFLPLALPFALTGIIARLYAYTDTIIISKMLGNEHLGWWSVPYKISFAFQFIPSALSASIYPVMSTLSITNPEKIGQLFEKAWKYLFLIVFPLTAGLIVLARPVVIKLYGASYAPSVPVLQVLLVSLIFGFLSFITGALLNATNHQKIQTTLFAVALVVNVVANFILLPRFGLSGAALAALLGNIILCGGGFYFSRRYAVIPLWPLFQSVIQTLVPALIMAVAVAILARKINFIIAIPLGILLYGALLFFTGALSRTLIGELWTKLRHQAPQSV